MEVANIGRKIANHNFFNLDDHFSIAYTNLP